MNIPTLEQIEAAKDDYATLARMYSDIYKAQFHSEEECGFIWGARGTDRSRHDSDEFNEGWAIGHAFFKIHKRASHRYY